MASSANQPMNSHGEPNSMSVGLSNSQLSESRRRMLDLVNRLHRTGVQVDIDLPQIAVIGSQSAGKSSLIESISGITLPRAAGTCTRCPTECRLSWSELPWHCIVSLRYTTDDKGQPIGQARNQIFGGMIFDKSEVEDRIRRAQRAILNPSKSYQHFLQGGEDAPETSELSFSMNCVCLQIMGPDVADLSFCDLPGLIASSTGNDGDIALVQKLVTAYIKKPSCIILLTVACETDFENQGAHRLTKEFDPDGKRTIGVLTKPDRIPTGEEGNWLPFIRNEKESLENNWFCVKQPSSNDLKSNMTWAQAREQEDTFFSMTAPWCDLDPVYQKYLRTSNLVDRLSVILSDLISKRLPQIQDELEKSIAATEEVLQSLPPPPPSNPQREVSSLLYNFISDLTTHVNGVPDVDGLLQAIRPAQERFRRAIRATAPNFRPFERQFEYKQHIHKAAFLVQEEGDVLPEEHSDDEADAEEQHVDGVDVEAVEGLTTMTSPSAQAQVVNGKKRKQAPSSKIYIDEVLDRAHRARTRELPGHYPFIVQQNFIEVIIKQWRDPALVLCKAIQKSILDHVKKLVEKHFAQFGQGLLEIRVRHIMQQHIARCAANAEAKINWYISVEERPFSLNTHYLSTYRTKFMAYYKGERQRYNGSGLAGVVAKVAENRQVFSTPVANGAVADQQEVHMNSVLGSLATLGLSGVKPEDLLKLLPPDDMDPALGIMADVRAYFQVAFKRFADVIPVTIDYELVLGVARNVLDVLHDGLKIDGEKGHDLCRQLAQESAQVASKREDLGKKLERLQTANHELMSIGV